MIENKNYMDMAKSNLKAGFLIFLFLLVFFLDRNLAIGGLMVILLSIITLHFIKKKEDANALKKLFLIGLAIHLAAVLFMHYAGFQPFSGGRGDYTTYNAVALEVSNRLHSGNLSLEGLSFSHYFPIFAGYLYFFTLPSMFIGQMFNAWAASIAILFVFLIVRKLGGSQKQGLLAGLIACFYPSFLFYSSMLLKDTWVALLSLISLYYAIEIIKAFSWKKFLIFYVFLGLLMHFRIYIGFALALTFIFCWLAFSNLQLKRRFGCGAAVILLLGLLPLFTTEQGYFGMSFLKQYLNVGQITYYREVVYVPEPSSSGQQSTATVEAGFDSPIKFTMNTLISFSYSFLGPFPWQMKHLRHLFALAETLAWYILLFFAFKGVIRLKKDYKIISPLIIFSLAILGVLALFINNFGIITRIRIPAFVSLICLVPFGINWISENKIIKGINRSFDFVLSA